MTAKLTPFDAAEYLVDEEAIAFFRADSARDPNPLGMVNALETVARARKVHGVESSGHELLVAISYYIVVTRCTSLRRLAAFRLLIASSGEPQPATAA